MRTLILGGARSGKSALAERLAQQSGLDVVYVATSTAGDTEMATRIAHHRARRPAAWDLVEEPLALADALERAARPDRCVLVDCLTLWLTNLLCAENENLFTQQHGRFLELLPSLPGELILVSNEVGHGIVPLGELTRRFVDEAGRLHQAVAAICDRAVLTVAGLPLPLKGSL